MPQISQLAATYASQIFWMAIFFGLIFFVIGRGMVPKVMATVDARDQQIAGDLAAAAAARDAADKAEETWRTQSNARRAEAQALIAKAKAEGAAAREAGLAQANAAIDARQAEADARIASARDGAMAEIESVAVEAAGDIVQRIAGLSVDPARAAGAVKEALRG